jgi:hypothetical protein
MKTPNATWKNHPVPSLSPAGRLEGCAAIDAAALSNTMHASAKKVVFWPPHSLVGFMPQSYGAVRLLPGVGVP